MASVNASPSHPEKGLVKGTNWWGAFVIGLAGTILVTGIAPYVVQGTGALGIILIGVMTIAGAFLCLCLAELACMWPDRAGGIPSYASASFEPLVGPKVAKHIGGLSGWSLIWAYMFIGIAGVTGFTHFATKLLGMTGATGYLSHPSLTLFALCVLVAWFLAYHSIRFSTILMLVFEGVSVALITCKIVSSVVERPALTVKTLDSLRLSVTLAVCAF